MMDVDNEEEAGSSPDWLQYAGDSHDDDTHTALLTLEEGEEIEQCFMLTKSINDSSMCHDEVMNAQWTVKAGNRDIASPFMGL